MDYEVLKLWRKNNPDKLKKQKWRYKLKRDYGISEKIYNDMFLEQNGCCKICRVHQSKFNKKLHVDHCHETGRVRGLLCQKCNHAIGLFNDDPEIIKSALEYVA